MTSFRFIKPDVISANMLNNNDLMKTFVSMYLDQCYQDFLNLSQAIADHDLAEVVSKAHHIKPTMEYIGATGVRMQFQAIENMAKDKREIAEIQRDFKKLESDFHTLMEELKIFYSSLS